MEINNAFIQKAINNHLRKHTKMKELFERYKGKHLNIENKQGSELMSINNKLKNNYRKIIVDQSVGYSFGNPVSFGLDKKDYKENETLYQDHYQRIQDFVKLNNINDLLPETEKKRACCGYAAWLVYRDTSSNIRVMLVNGWNVTFVTDDNGEIIAAIRYYHVTRNDEVKRKVEVYDKQNIYHFIESGGVYVPDNTEEKNPRPHNFGYVPVIKVKNNEEEQGDFEAVESLIDAYDELLSSVQDEVEAFRMAYLAIYGAQIDPEDLAKIKKTGVLQIPNSDSESKNQIKIEWLTKNLSDTVHQNQKATLNENIYKFASAIDMSDEKFSGGGETGESRKWKLISLENKAIVKERKMEVALNELFKIVCSGWEKEFVTIDYLKIFYTFKRNLPVDLNYLADVASKFKGTISEDTRLGLLNGVVDDVEYEKRQMKEDNEGSIDLSAPIVDEEEK